MKKIWGIVISLVLIGFSSGTFAAEVDQAIPAALPDFLNWVQRYENSSVSATLETDGFRMAEKRRAALKELIRTDPRRALEHRLPDDLVATFPKSVVALLGENVSGPARFEVLAGIPLPGKSAPPIIRKATIGNKTYAAFVDGKLATLTSRREVWLTGLAVDDVIALDDNFIDETPAAQNDVLESPATEGIKRLLLIRVDFSDFQGLFFSTTDATNQVIELNNFFATSSYGRAGFRSIGSGSSVTPLLRMPKLSHLYVDNFTLMVDDARGIAAAAGYNTNQYDYYVVCFPGLAPGYPYCGQGRVGEPGSIVVCFNSRVFAHELGHNYGLFHANFWYAGERTVIGPGSSVEYGDTFDTMGSGGPNDNHFNARYKNILNWLRNSEFTMVVSNGTYRIKAQDDASATGVRALKIVKNADTNYWIEFRQKLTFNKWSMNGVGLRWGGNFNEPTLLLDTTPGSPNQSEDSSAVAGRTFSDAAAGIHITALRKAGTVPEAFDVVVNLGNFPANVAPNATMTSSSTSVTPGTPITFQVSASDPNGDALAYYWDFGDGDFGTNGVIQSHAWNVAGGYAVLCIVSDMKGGLKTNITTITVGIPLGEAVDSPALPWISGGDSPWFGQSDVTHNSSDAASSGTIADSQESWLQTSVTGPGKITFWWKVSSESSDSLQFQINGIERDRISGEVDWQQQTYFLVSGNQTLRWRYSKDLEFRNSHDRGWLDQIFFTPGGTAPIITTQLAAQTIPLGSSTSLTLGVQGTPPLRFQWRKNNSNIFGETNSSLSVSNAQVTDNGTYAVAIQNDYNSVTSSNALLLVLPNLFYDDFEGGIDLSQWSRFGGEVRATNYGGSLLGTNALWFNGHASRFATTKPLKLIAGGTIQFHLRFALGFDFPWSFLQVPDEGVTVEFSVNGTTWTTLGVFDTSEFYEGVFVQIPLPAAVNSSATQFRWRQLSHSGAGSDHWTLDDARIFGTQFTFSTARQAGANNFSFLIAGPVGRSCRIQTSTNLTTWSNVRTNILTNGILTFVDSISPGQSRRFYRAALIE